MKRTNKNAGVQLSLFENDYRDRTNKELIAELTDNPDQVAEEWEWNYSMERLYNSLTPKHRRIAAAAVELYKRREIGRSRSKCIRTSEDIARIMRPLLTDLEIEEFWLLPLSHGGGAMKPIRISTGSIDQTSVDVRIIMRKLVEVSATQFAVIHNHPSGNRYTENDRTTLGNYKVNLPEGHTYESYAKFLLQTMPPYLAEHYTAKIKKFLAWWEKEGVTSIPDYADMRDEAKRKVPSWRRICKVLLKNDYWCKGLSFAQTKRELEKQVEMITRYTNEL